MTKKSLMLRAGSIFLIQATFAGVVRCVVEECISSSNRTLVMFNPKLQEVSDEIFNQANTDWESWHNCTTDFLGSELKDNNTTCDYDLIDNKSYDSYVGECQKAGGVIYVWDYLIECNRRQNHINISQKNHPYCILLLEPSCKNVTLLDAELAAYNITFFDDRFRQAGFSCEVQQSDFIPYEDPNNEKNMGLIIGLSVLGFVVLFILCVIYCRDPLLQFLDNFQMWW